MPPGDDDIAAMLRDMRREQQAGFKQVHSRLDRIDTRLDTHTHEDARLFEGVRGEIADARQAVEAQVNGVREAIDDVRSEHGRTQQRVAMLEGKDEGEQRATTLFGPNGTGRFPVVPSGSHPDLSQFAHQQPQQQFTNPAQLMGGPTPPMGTLVVPTPPPGQAFEVRVGAPERDRRDHSSLPPPISWVARLLSRFFRSTAGKVGSALGLLAGGAIVHWVLSIVFAATPVTGGATTTVQKPAVSATTFPPTEPPTLPAIPAAMPGFDASVQQRDSGAGLHR